MTQFVFGMMMLVGSYLITVCVMELVLWLKRAR